MSLLSTTKAALATGFSRNTVQAVKKTAFGTPDDPFRGGRFTTKVLLEQWIVNHPDFRASHVWKQKERPQHPLHLLRSAAGTRGAQSRWHGQQSASPSAA